MTLFLLALTGVGVGALGTLIGAGGGFLVVPLLILGFGAAPVSAAGTSLIMVTVNSLVGTIAYARQGKVDWRGGLFLIAASYPGTILGATLGSRLPARDFSLVFALLLLVVAVWMLYHVVRGRSSSAPVAALGGAAPGAPDGLTLQAAQPETPAGGWRLCRQLTEVGGRAYAFCFLLPLGALLSFSVGFVGAMLGIGGGPLLVPMLTYALHYPVHIATATSQFTISMTSLAAAGIYFSSTKLDMQSAVILSLGTVVGAPFGAWLSRRVNARYIIALLSCALIFIAAELLKASPGLH